jgi:hypothetical protein
MKPADAGWPWFDGSASAENSAAAEGMAGPSLAAAFTRCFATDAGRTVLRHLCSVTLERTAAPDAPESVLRHLEGQRFIVRYLQQLVERGRAAPGSHPRAISQINEVDTMPIGEP